MGIVLVMVLMMVAAGGNKNVLMHASKIRKSDFITCLHFLNRFHLD